jgi:hypothetical protein
MGGGRSEEESEARKRLLQNMLALIQHSDERTL